MISLHAIEPTATAVETKATLDDKTIKMLTWKNKTMAAIAVNILMALGRSEKCYADEISMSFVPAESKNCIGMAWRNLKGMGMIVSTGQFRPSKKKSRHGNPIWQYRIDPKGRGLCVEFLKRNDAFLPSPQPDVIFDQAKWLAEIKVWARTKFEFTPTKCEVMDWNALWTKYGVLGTNPHDALHAECHAEA